MNRPERALVAQIALVVVLVAAFVPAELLRGSDPVRATILSMAGWAAFVVLAFSWLWEGCGLRAGLRRTGRLLALTAVAFAVLLLYHQRSQLLAAGIEVDAGYTFLGLEWFFLLDNPITFAGRTSSFAQFPLALLTHVPGYLIGFERIGPFAIQLGIMLQIAVLLSLMTTFFVERRIPVQAATVALAAGVFSNRLTLLLYNLTGYGIPAVSVGVIFLVIAIGDRTPSVLFPRVGGLLVLSLLHHYPGVFFVLPLVALWVVAARAPWRRVMAFLRANVPLWAVVLIAVSCVAIRPELLLNRLLAVTTPSLELADFQAKLVGNWSFLTRVFPGAFVELFFRKTPGSWHLLDIPPLAGPLPYVVCANWLVTAVALGWRGVGYVARLVLLAIGLLVLTVLQHLVTGFENYRDMVLLMGMTTTGIGFVFLIPGAGAVLRVMLIGYALAVAAFDYVDVAALAGRQYGVEQYAPAAQATTETVRRFWRRHRSELRDATIAVIVPEPFPLAPIYASAALRDGLALQFVDTEAFCKDPVGVVGKLLADVCGRLSFAVSARACLQRWRVPLGWPPSHAADGTALYRFDAACGDVPPRAASAAEPVDLDP